MLRYASVYGLAALVTAFVASCSPGKTVVFNHIAGPPTADDELIHRHFGRSFDVTDVPAERNYAEPRGIRGFGPMAPVYNDGQCVSGGVLVFYVITANGSVSAPYVVKTTNGVLSAAAVKTVSKWEFDPARLDNYSVSTIAGSYLRFVCPVTGASSGRPG